MTPPIMAAIIRFSRIVQLIKNEIIDGTATMAAIIVPFKTISLILSLGFVGSDTG